LSSNNPDWNDPILGDNAEGRFQVFVYNSVTGYVKYLGWIMIPILGFFIIPGLFLTGKKPTKNKMIFLSFIIFISITSLYAYGRGIQETRYLYPLIPIFVLFACNFFNYLMKYNFKKIMLMTVFAVIISSFIFVEYRNPDYVYESEMYDATLFLINIANGVNDYEGNRFIKVAELQNSWPELLPKGENGKMKPVTKKFFVEGFDEPLEYIRFNEDNGLTHLLIQEGDREGFFDDIFVNEGNYPFLEKIYDSNDSDKTTKYKIFKINYEELK